MIYGSRRTLELLDKESLLCIDSKELINEIDNKTIEMKKERQKFFDQRREYNKMIIADGRREHLYEALRSAAENLTSSVGQMFDNTVENNKSESEASCKNDEAEAILVFSDWHYGMTTSNIFNKYNTSICKKRVKTVTDAAIERIRLHSCKKLHVVVLGDLFHGAIHTSARVASEELVCEQLMQASEILAQAIERLGHEVSQLFVYTTYGNHARTVQNKKENIHRDNMERLIPWWLSQRLSTHNNITVMPEEENEFIFVNACGHDICASHGDLDSVKSSPRLLSTLFSKKYGKDIEYIILGDKHHPESFDELGVTATICGSLCGTDDYANDKRLFSQPSQLLIIVNEKDGIDAEYRIKC